MKNENLSIVKKELPKLLILGYGRHGKDTVCEMLREWYHFKFVSSSFFMAGKVIFPQLAPLYGYKTVDECYADRHNHRAEWFDIIAETNKDDAASLGKALFKEYDIYCGCRNEREVQAMKDQKVYDLCIWVDRSSHQPPEDRSSCTVHHRMADLMIDNNGTLADLEDSVKELARAIL